jgi:hypothetical protein
MMGIEVQRYAFSAVLQKKIAQIAGICAEWEMILK